MPAPARFPDGSINYAVILRSDSYNDDGDTSSSFSSEEERPVSKSSPKKKPTARKLNGVSPKKSPAKSKTKAPAAVYDTPSEGPSDDEAGPSEPRSPSPEPEPVVSTPKSGKKAVRSARKEDRIDAPRERKAAKRNVKANKGKTNKTKLAPAIAPVVPNGKHDDDSDDDSSDRSSAVETEALSERSLAVTSTKSSKSRASGFFTRDIKVDKQADQRSSVTSLTRVERHYLAKALCDLQMQREFSALSQVGELALYGAPFADHATGPLSKPKSAKKGLLGFGGGAKKDDVDLQNWDVPLDPPILRYLFWRFLYHFPALREAKASYWYGQIQPFFDGFAEKTFSTTSERSELTKRRILSFGLTRILGTYFSTCVTALGDVAPARPDTTLMRKVDLLFPGTMDEMVLTLYGSREKEPGFGYNAWVAIPESKDGYGAKQAFVLSTRLTVTPGTPLFFVSRTWAEFKTFSRDLEMLNDDDRLNIPVLPMGRSFRDAPDRLTLQRYIRTAVIALSNPSPSVKKSPRLQKARTRLEQFLLDKPMDVSERRRREYITNSDRDDRRLTEQRDLWLSYGKRARKLRTTYNMYRDALISANELQRSFDLLYKHSKITQLPPVYRETEEFVRIWAAYLLHYLFVSSPNAAELCHLLKSFHDLIPYALIKGFLRIANPTLMIKALVNFILGQPFGQTSLFQRIFSIVCNSDIKTRTKDIEQLRRRIGQDQISNILRDYVNQTDELREESRKISQETGQDIVYIILKNNNLDDAKLHQVKAWRDAFAYMRWTSADVSTELRASRTDEEALANKYKELKKLLRAYSTRRDRQKVVDIVMESNTATMLKSSISVFYGAIYKIAQAANLADRLGDLQAFITDLLATAMQSKKPSIAAFIKLAQRHEQSLYFFLHELHHNGGDLTKPIIAWSRGGLNFIKNGIPESPGGSGGKGQRRYGVDVDGLLEGVSSRGQAKILAEVQSVALYTKQKKCEADIMLRCDLLEAYEGIKLNAADLYSTLVSEDRDVAAYSARVGRKSTRDEYQVDWAWFAHSDLLNNPGGKIKTRSSGSSSGGSSRGGSGGPSPAKRRVLPPGEDDSDDDTYAAHPTASLPPPPPLFETSKLLPPYLDSLTAVLKAARNADIK
ncbi:uncharacterized protein L969DRAFT_51051 [Mixia osmundae IAM 14324]|uniref:PX domain-containing protein n=1 Tax=Mixia osmundae (strain CBS 9802 / IAM 14324 / JCM 22182 / KY 12970) TaxID=764103 RepID=G7E7L9_MIXOS|nr:uncharacterized protein L969DRAFT_51051 [Mixia osmundae IAM 14324]KEI38430.1 hypothetical protein L969DRAFT_51051 [Mixia osmundae IAM 14324]GAA98829.1 hypothetical protein E5Q_05517 [Mixia osmundae IAM 14324]